MKLNHFQKKIPIIKLFRKRFIHLRSLKNETFRSAYHSYPNLEFDRSGTRYWRNYSNNNDPLSGLYTSILPTGV